MVIKGGSRGGPADLAAHLQRTDTNERMELIEVRGVAALGLEDALREMDAVASGTRCTRPLYHASINVRADEVLTTEQWNQAIDMLEAKMSLTDQPRTVVLHEKEGREHVHIVWSRIDLDRMRSISDSHNYRRHEEVARALEKEFGHARVQGAHVGRDGAERPDRTPTHAEMQQAERTGLTPQEAKEQITALWQRTDSGQAFAAAIADQGWILARGDRRDFVVIDSYGEAHSLARRIEGAKAKDVRERMTGIDAANLPSVEEAAGQQRTRQAAIVEKEEGAAVAAERGIMQEPTEAELQHQQQREQDQLRQVEAQAAQLDTFRRQREAEIEEARKRERENQEHREKEIRAGDISDAGTRYSVALGQAGGTNPYQTLANASLAEGAAFKKEQETLRKEAAAEGDPEKRALIELRRQIEAHEYMAATSKRLAGISAVLAGRESNPISEGDREAAKLHSERAKALREERSQRQAEQERQERQEREKAQQSPEAQKQAAIDRYRAAVGRTAPSRQDEVPYHQRVDIAQQREGLRPGQPTEGAPPSREAREAARASYQRARDGAATPSKEQDDSGGKSTGQTQGRGGGRGR